MNHAKYTKIYEGSQEEWEGMKKLKAGEYCLLFNIMNKATYAAEGAFCGGLIVQIKGKHKKQLLEELEISEKTLEKYLTQLTRFKIIRRCKEAQGSGVYQLNPFIFGKGEEKRMEILRQWARNYGWFSEEKKEEGEMLQADEIIGRIKYKREYIKRSKEHYEQACEEIKKITAQKGATT